MLHDTTGAYSMDVHLVDREGPPAWLEHADGRVLELPGVGPPARDKMDDGVSADDFVFDLEPEIGKRPEPRCYHRADQFAASAPR